MKNIGLRRVVVLILALTLLLPVALASFDVAEAASPAIVVGDRVAVTSYGDGVSVRPSYSTGSGLIRTMPAGYEGEVISGPQHNEGYRWWRIRWFTGDVGWTADAYLDGTPYLRPLPGKGVYPSVTHNGLSYRVRVYADAVNLAVRSVPGTGASLITRKAPGSRGWTLSDTPVVTQEMVWWNIRWDDGVTGWSSDSRSHTEYGVYLVKEDAKSLPGPVSVATYSAQNEGQTQATLRGAITSLNGNESAQIRFWYKPVIGGSWTSTAWATRTNTTTYSRTIYGLTPGTEYQFYAEGRGSLDTTLRTGGTVRFDTLPSDPHPAGPVSVATHSAQNEGQTQATLRGAITYFNNNPSAQIRFWYKPVIGGSWASTSWVSRTSTTTYSETVYGLTPNTEYQFYAEGRGSTDTTLDTGSTRYFETRDSDPDPAGPVSVATYSATGVGETQATLRGAITAFNNNPSAQLSFRYREQGTTTWTYTPWVTRTSTAIYSRTVTGLSPGTDYEFEAEGYGSVDTTVRWGSTEHFTTETGYFGIFFTSDKTEVEVGETVTFTNLTSGGTLPYTMAEWDFGDGTIKSIVGTHTEIMADVTHVYADPGTYTVGLTMEDSVFQMLYISRSDYITVTTVNAPIARYTDISGQPQVMYPDEPYTVTAEYFDPDGREDLQYCYLRLVHPDKPLTMMWNQARNEFWVREGELGENYLAVSGDATPITEGGLEGYQLEWTFTINDQWPEVESAINFGVFALDDSGLESGISVDNAKASFIKRLAFEIGMHGLSTGAEIDSAWVREVFRIHVTVNQGSPAEVRVSDDNTHGAVHPESWTSWYTWDGDSLDLIDEDTRSLVTVFRSGGPKRVWVQVRDLGGEIISDHIESFANFSFAHMTDTHMAYHIRPLKTVRPRAEYWLAGTLQKMKEHGHMRPQFILVTGDIVEAAYWKPLPSLFDPSPDCRNLPYFETFSDVVDMFSLAPVYTVPGNHDRYCVTNDSEFGWIYAPYDKQAGLERYNRVLGDRRPDNATTISGSPCGHDDYEFKYGGLQFIGIDSGYSSENVYVAEWSWPPVYVDGMGLTTQQITALQRQPQGVPKVLFMHHPLITGDGRGEIRRNRPALEEFLKTHNVQLVLAGHTHSDWLYVDEGVQHVISPATVGDGAGYRLIHVTQDEAGSIEVKPQEIVRITRADANSIVLSLGSPVNLEVYDLDGRRMHITKDGVIVDEIPYAIYTPSPFAHEDHGEDTPLGSVLLFDISQEYRYVVRGIDTGTYDLSVELWDGSEESTWFWGKDITCTEGSVHHYSIDWDALSRGEEGVTIEMDDDGDGIIDRSLTSGSMMASVETATQTGTAFFKPSDGVIMDLEALPAIPRGAPADAFPHGMFQFTVTEIEPGDTVTITVELPEAVPDDFSWWKHDGARWHSLPIERTADPNVIKITLTDGEFPGDIDGEADGKITDPGGPGGPFVPRELVVGWEGSSVDKASVIAPWIALLSIIAGTSLLILRRRQTQS